MKHKYCDGTDLIIKMENGKIVNIKGWFYDRVDSCKPTHKNITNEIGNIENIKIRYPHEILMCVTDIILNIEYFTSLIVLETTLIIEV